MSTTTIEAVHRSVSVDVTPEHAFDVFVNHIADWWPLETHSQSAMHENGRPDTLVFEARAGGEVYEQRGEERHHWGFVTVWEPPHRLVLDWKVNPDWAAPTEVEITFTPEGGGTRVDLEHRGWERLTERAPEFRASYNDGWVPVLDRFGQAANA